jgi:hypothetical protein
LSSKIPKKISFAKNLLKKIIQASLYNIREDLSEKERKKNILPKNMAVHKIGLFSDSLLLEFLGSVRL